MTTPRHTARLDKLTVQKSEPAIGKIEPAPELAATLGSLERPCCCDRVRQFQYFRELPEEPVICDRCLEEIEKLKEEK